MKVLFRILAVLVVAVGSVILVQRLFLKLYTDVGKRYIVIEEQESA